MFESSFPETPQQVLLEKYRQHIITKSKSIPFRRYGHSSTDSLKGGAAALRTMDVLAHDAWMTEPKFAEETLCNKSQELAIDLGVFLAPALQSNVIDEEMHDREGFP